MSKRDWWLGVALIALALLVHALVPRYEWRGDYPRLIRIDRWTGEASRGELVGGRWP